MKITKEEIESLKLLEDHVTGIGYEIAWKCDMDYSVDYGYEIIDLVKILRRIIKKAEEES